MDQQSRLFHAITRIAQGPHREDSAIFCVNNNISHRNNFQSVLSAYYMLGSTARQIPEAGKSYRGHLMADMYSQNAYL